MNWKELPIWDQAPGFKTENGIRYVATMNWKELPIWDQAPGFKTENGIRYVAT